jgi:hypothetical protein
MNARSSNEHFFKEFLGATTKSKIRGLFGQAKQKLDVSMRPPMHYPAYLLLTNKYAYLMCPLFSLSLLTSTLQDEQTAYLDSHNLIEVGHKVSIEQLTWLDVGPGRQYIAFHTLTQKENQKDVITSIVFSTRSRQSTTTVLDFIHTVSVCTYSLL